MLECKLYKRPKQKLLEKSLGVVATLIDKDKIKYTLFGVNSSVKLNRAKFKVKAAQISQGHIASLRI